MSTLVAAAVKIRIVGFTDWTPITWPDGWPPPREGEPVHVGDNVLYVRTVAWYPQGDKTPEPFVYVVLGPRRQP
jgi:hypothetical protein